MSAGGTAPRVVVAGLAGDSGKTFVALGFLLLAKEQGLAVRGFKKGPDYIDAAWLTWAAGHPARNLDTYLMGFERPVASFARHAAPDGLNVIEGNRGLFDGADARGTHSTAELAKILGAPVVLVLNATKVTRTAAAFVLGCQYLDPKLRLAGVILNRVGTRRQESVLREAIESASGVPVLGVIPKAGDAALLPGRHLGLVTPAEHPRIAEVQRNVLELVRDNVDLDRLLEVARQAPPPRPAEQVRGATDEPVRIGYLRDSAFTFYYPENLEALEAAGAALVPISSLKAPRLPEGLDALYIGGGFPETHGARLSANTAFLIALQAAASRGLAIYAECGGLMLLARAIHWDGRRYPMAGVLPFEVEVRARPEGHGYCSLTVDRTNPFFPEGAVLRGHEFHYSRVLPRSGLPPTACRVDRGTGCYAGRDGVIVGNVWASYTHLHALATPEWAKGLIAAGRRTRNGRR